MTYVLKGSGYRYSVETSVGIWSWSVDQSTDPSSPEPILVQDLRSPFGRLDQVLVPVPGSVLSAIYESIQDFQEFLTPNLVFSPGSPVSLSLSVTQGDSMTSVGSLVISNNGAYGSTLSIAGSVEDSYLSVNPGYAGGVAKNNTASFTVYVDPNVLDYSSSPYTSTVTFANSNNLLNQVVAPITINVLPQPIIEIEHNQLDFVYNRTSGVFTGPLDQLVYNSGPVASLLTVLISKMSNCSPWLSLSSWTLTNIAPGDFKTVVLSLNNTYFPGLDGVYREVIKVYSPNSSNGSIMFNVVLTVTS